ncbi:MAG: hypothetical protein H6759_02110 [Candidatus Nomurabacteria bacterium]|nr:MAG: hypothetical protein H6759_02110 [Candidatus Nomurabacteria bacterium]
MSCLWPHQNPVRVRLCSKPYGLCAYRYPATALYNWFLARNMGGTFLLRVEDTDRARYVEGSIENPNKGDETMRS